jgi:hypothetical protein
MIQKFICAGLCMFSLTACLATGSSAPEQPEIIARDAADGNAVPLPVILALPQGVSATSVTEGENGCFSYLTPSGYPLPVSAPDGQQICLD